MEHTRNIAWRYYSLVNYVFLSPNKKTMGYVPMCLPNEVQVSQNVLRRERILRILIQIVIRVHR